MPFRSRNRPALVLAIASTIVCGCAGAPGENSSSDVRDADGVATVAEGAERAAQVPVSAGGESAGPEVEGVRVRYSWVYLRHFFESRETVVCVPVFLEPWAACGVLATVDGLSPSTVHTDSWESHPAGDGEWVHLGWVDVEGVVNGGVLSDPTVFLERTSPLERECNFSGGEVQMQGIPRDAIALSSGHPVYVWNAFPEYLQVALNYGSEADFDEICALGARAKLRSYGEVLEPSDFP